MKHESSLGCTFGSPFIDFDSNVLWWPLLLMHCCTLYSMNSKSTKYTMVHVHILPHTEGWFFHVKKETAKTREKRLETNIKKQHEVRFFDFENCSSWLSYDRTQNMCFILTFIYYSEYVNPHAQQFWFWTISLHAVYFICNVHSRVGGR